MVDIVVWIVAVLNFVKENTDFFQVKKHFHQVHGLLLCWALEGIFYIFDSSTKIDPKEQQDNLAFLNIVLLFE